MSDLARTIKSQVDDARRAGDAFRRDTLNLLVDAIYKAEKRDRREYSADEVLGIISREAKTRRESIGSVPDWGSRRSRPQERVRDRTHQWVLAGGAERGRNRSLVAEAVRATGAAGPRDTGKVMGWLTPKTRGVPMARSWPRGF